VLSWAATGRRYFSRAIGLGVTEPATEEQLDRILAAWEAQGITMFRTAAGGSAGATGEGARRFIADIEAPSEKMDTPAYEYFGRLGFTRPYVGTHWAVV
jgi:hypothetical protein